MAVYRIADLTVKYDCVYNTLKSRSEKYLCDEKEAQIELSLDEDYYISRRKVFPDTSDEMLEYMGMGTAFYKELLSFEGMMLHSSAVAFDGEAYLFSAPSGVGKSTHTQKWLEVFPNAFIINDDKPAIRKISGKYYAFGTPFSGKNDVSVNGGYPIKGICFIDRGDNQIQRIESETALKPLFNQTIRPVDKNKMDLLCDRVEDILKCIPFYVMHCDVSVDAVKMAYDKMK